MSLHHGDFFLGEPVPRDPGRIDSFQLVGPDGVHPVMGLSGNVTSVARPEHPGLHVIAYHSGRLRSELPGDKFNQYLREKGLAQIADLRAQRGDCGQPGREVYSRCAKAIIWAGDIGAPDGAAGAPQGDRVVGLPLEIVAEGNPYALHAGSLLRLHVLFQGEPRQGATVVAVNRDDPTQRFLQLTDERGRAAFKLAEPGAWMFSCVHMVVAPRETDADWESFWASLTFELPQR